MLYTLLPRHAANPRYCILKKMGRERERACEEKVEMKRVLARSVDPQPLAYFMLIRPNGSVDDDGEEEMVMESK